MSDSKKDSTNTKTENKGKYRASQGSTGDVEVILNSTNQKFDEKSRNSDKTPYVSKFSHNLQKDFSFIKRTLRSRDQELRGLKHRIEKLERFRSKRMN